MVANATEDQVEQISESLNKFGIVNPFTQAAIMAIVSKESAFKLGNGENMNYSSASRIRFVWPSLFKTDADAAPYVNNPQALANKVYGGKYGNTGANDGWLYRGRGYNGITFKSAYDRFGKMIGADLVNNPDLLNQPEYAADALAAYFADTFSHSGGELQKMGVKDANDFRDLETAVHGAMRANAGWKSSQTGNIFLEGKARAMQNAPAFYNYVKQLDTTANSRDEIEGTPGTDIGGKPKKIKRFFSRMKRKLSTLIHL